MIINLRKEANKKKVDNLETKQKCDKQNKKFV